MDSEEREILEEKLVRLRQLSKNLDESFTTVSYTHLTLPTTPYV